MVLHVTAACLHQGQARVLFDIGQELPYNVRILYLKIVAFYWPRTHLLKRPYIRLAGRT